MAQVGTSAPISNPAPDTSPSQSQTSILPEADAITNSIECNSVHLLSTPQPTAETPGESDVEVQFIFSAPRRRKKKRRRVESSHISTETFQGLNGSTGPQKSATLSEPPRRGTTGMVQRLESCHIGGIKDKPTSGISRSGSLPLVSPVINANPKSRSPIFNSSNSSKPSSQFLPFAPFMLIPWQENPSIQLQAAPTVQNNWAPMQPEDKMSSKRKREGEVQQHMLHPTQRSQIRQSSTRANSLETDGMDRGPMDMLDTNRTATNSTNAPSPTSKMQSFCWNSRSNINRSHDRFPTPNTRKSSASDVMGPNLGALPQASAQMLGSLRHNHPNQNGGPQNQTVTVPARLVPEQIVSPRTQTVEVPRLSLVSQAQARYMMLLQRDMTLSDQHVPSPRGPSGIIPSVTNNQFQIPRSVPPQKSSLQCFQRPQQNVLLNRPRNVQTRPFDILRKPSLYKVPPWPSPPSLTSPTQLSSSVSTSSASNTSLGSSRLGTNTTVNSGISGFSGPQSGVMISMQGTAGKCSLNNFPAQRLMPETPPRTPPPQFQTRSSLRSSSPPPTQSQLYLNKRKHSPNLIVDIAETCQENFPFAAVAERHQIPIQKVFDTFSAIIQLPLLRSASDSRRHGSLGKRRMKEFREARKAMEKEMKDKDAGAGHAGGGGRRRKSKKRPDQPLLRAAILNNASKGKDASS